MRSNKKKKTNRQKSEILMEKTEDLKEKKIFF